MPLPHSFLSGTVAKSSEVNTNFNYVMDILGQLSVPGSISPLGEFRVGPRSLGVITGAQDDGPNEQAYFQVAWNVHWSKVGLVWKYARKIEGQPATALLLGRNGLEVKTTSSTSGDLNNQMTTVLRLKATTSQDYLFLKDDVHMQNYDGDARNIQDYRLTTVFLETPIPIYKDKALPFGTTVFNAYNLGVPSHAKGIVVYLHITAPNESGVGMHVYQRRLTYATDGSQYFRGVVCHAPIGVSGKGMRSGAQGLVPLGVGTQKGDFVVHRTASIYLSNVAIVGYLT